MATNTAFEAVTTRNAWYAAATLAKYDAVMFDDNGKYVKATGAKPFAGVVEYGGDSGDVVTVVRGVFPGVAAAAIAAGDKLKITATDAGKWTPTTTTGDAVIGIALTAAAAAGATVSVQMLETPFTVA